MSGPEDAFELAKAAADIPKFVGDVVVGGVEGINAALNKLAKASSIVSKQRTEVVSVSHEELLKEASLISAIPVQLGQAERRLDGLLSRIKTSLQDPFPPKQQALRKSLDRWKSLVDTLEVLYETQALVQHLALIDSDVTQEDLASLSPKRCRQIAASLETTLTQLSNETVRVPLMRVSCLQQPIRSLLQCASELRNIGNNLCTKFAEAYDPVESASEVQDLRCGLHILHYVGALNEDIHRIQSAALIPLNQHLEEKASPERLLESASLASTVLRKALALDYVLNDVNKQALSLSPDACQHRLSQEIEHLYDHHISTAFSKFHFAKADHVKEVLSYQAAVQQLQQLLSNMVPMPDMTIKLPTNEKKVNEGVSFFWGSLMNPLNLMFPHMAHVYSRVDVHKTTEADLAKMVQPSTLLRTLPTKKDMSHLVSAYTPLTTFPQSSLVKRMDTLFIKLLQLSFESTLPATQELILTLDGLLKPINRAQTAKAQIYVLLDQFISGVGSTQLIQFAESLLSPWLHEIQQLLLTSVMAVLATTADEGDTASRILDLCEQTVQSTFTSLLQPLTPTSRFHHQYRRFQHQCLKRVAFEWISSNVGRSQDHRYQRLCMTKLIQLLKNMNPKTLSKTSRTTTDYELLEDLLRLTCGDITVLPETDSVMTEQRIKFVNNPSKLSLEIIAYALLHRLPGINRQRMTNLNLDNVSILRVDLIPSDPFAAEDLQLSSLNLTLQQTLITLVAVNYDVLKSIVQSGKVRYDQIAAEFLLAEYGAERAMRS